MTPLVHPFALGLFAVGSYYRWLSSRKLFDLILFIGSLEIAVHSYTPSLALLAAGCCLLVLVSIKRNRAVSQTQRIACALAFVLLALSLARTFQYRLDVRLFSPAADGGNDGTFQAFKDSMNFVAFSNGFISYPLKLICILVFAYSLFVLRRFAGYFSVLFLAAAMVAAGILKGYNFLQADWRMHRAIVAVPFVMLLLFLSITHFADYLRKRKGGQAFFVSLAFFFPAYAWTGIDYRLNYLEGREPHPHLLLFSAISQSSASPQSPILLHISNELGFDFVSIQDLLGYFRPNSRAEILPDECKSKLIRKIQESDVLFTPEFSSCASAGLATRICAKNTWQAIVIIRKRRLLICAPEEVPLARDET